MSPKSQFRTQAVIALGLAVLLVAIAAGPARAREARGGFAIDGGSAAADAVAGGCGVEPVGRLYGGGRGGWGGGWGGGWRGGWYGGRGWWGPRVGVFVGPAWGWGPPGPWGYGYPAPYAYPPPYGYAVPYGYPPPAYYYEGRSPLDASPPDGGEGAPPPPAESP